MITSEKIHKFLSKNFPQKKAEAWDKVGLIYGNVKTNVKNILVALDLTTEVFDYAIAKKCELIIVHHPFLFEKTIYEDFSKAPYKQELHKRLINSDMGLIVMHTNYDSSYEGTTKQLIDTIGFKQWKPLANSQYGGIVETNLRLTNLLKLISDKLQINHFQSNFPFENKIAFNKIAFLPGSGDIKDILNAHREGASLIFTSDIKWSTWLVAQEHKVKLVNYTHSVENVFVKHVANILTNNFSKINIFTFKVVIKNYLLKSVELEHLTEGKDCD